MFNKIVLYWTLGYGFFPAPSNVAEQVEQYRTGEQLKSFESK